MTLMSIKGSKMLIKRLIKWIKDWKSQFISKKWNKFDHLRCIFNHFQSILIFLIKSGHVLIDFVVIGFQEFGSKFWLNLIWLQKKIKFGSGSITSPKLSTQSVLYPIYIFLLVSFSIILFWRLLMHSFDRNSPNFFSVLLSSLLSPSSH